MLAGLVASQLSFRSSFYNTLALLISLSQINQFGSFSCVSTKADADTQAIREALSILKITCDITKPLTK